MTEMEKKIREYREYKRMIEELEELTTAIADELKAAMVEAGKEKMIVGEYKLSYTDTTRTSLDRHQLEADLGDLTKYEKTITYKTFRIA